MAYHGHDVQRDDDSSHKRPYSIDLTLELERQLENESLPPTPAHNVRSASGHQLPDPNVMASIIVQLRQSLADVTEERDALRHRLTEIQSQDSFVKDTLRDMAEKCTRAQSELEAARQKIKDDEEAISMLRAKVEESRCVVPLSHMFHMH
jgi:septal ring factor EnvC (AmiA/AmiB activator)